MIKIYEPVKMVLEQFNEVFTQFLVSNNYHQSSLCFNRLNCENENFPANPSMQSTWENLALKLRFKAEIYSDGMMFLEVIDTKGNIVNFNDFINQEKINTETMYTSEVSYKEKFNYYLKQNLSLIKTTVLFEVIKGEKWITTKFDWQNQK